jgi:uncharacterized protein YjiS (DUF1127 family)
MTCALPAYAAPQHCEHHRGSTKSFRTIASERFAAFAAMLSNAIERAHQRADLAELSDHLLRDIGQTRQQALEQAAKKFWS